MGDEFDEPDPEQRGDDGGGLRRQLENLQRELKETKDSLPTQLQEAREQGAQQAQRRFEATSFFGSDKPKLAERWVEEHPDKELTKEAAAEFASAYGVKLEETPDPEPTPEPVSPAVRQAAEQFHESTAPTTGTEAPKSYSEMDAILRNNPAKGLRLIREQVSRKAEQLQP